MVSVRLRGPDFVNKTVNKTTTYNKTTKPASANKRIKPTAVAATKSRTPVAIIIKSNTILAKEQAIREKCNLLNIPYEPPKANENSNETKNSRQRLTRQCTKLLSNNNNNVRSVNPVSVPTNSDKIVTTNNNNARSVNPVSVSTMSNLPQTLPVIAPIPTETQTSIVKLIMATMKTDTCMYTKE